MKTTWSLFKRMRQHLLAIFSDIVHCVILVCVNFILSDRKKSVYSIAWNCMLSALWGNQLFVIRYSSFGDAVLYPHKQHAYVTQSVLYIGSRSTHSPQYFICLTNISLCFVSLMLMFRMLKTYKTTSVVSVNEWFTNYKVNQSVHIQAHLLESYHLVLLQIKIHQHPPHSIGLFITQSVAHIVKSTCFITLQCSC